MYIITKKNIPIIKKELLKNLRILRLNIINKNVFYNRCLQLSFSIINKRLETEFNYLLEKENITIESIPF